MKRIARPFVTLVVLALTGCGSVLPQPSAPPALYHLTPASDFPAPPRRIAVQLAVDTPMAEAALDTTRIALARNPVTLDYFADAAWTDHLASMVQALLIQTLDNAHRLAAIGPQTGALRGDVVLVTELRHFEAAYAGSSPPRWQIEIIAKLVKLPERTLLADRAFRGDELAARNDLATIVDAANIVWRRVATELADWTADSLTPRAR